MMIILLKCFLTVLKELKKIYEKFKDPKEMIFTFEDEVDFKYSTCCYVCKKYLGTIKKYNKVKLEYIDSGRPDKVRD